jgi:maltooligosyltrehalose trehalohydrolase
MGEEYAELAPFQYFVSHSDPGLVDAVRRAGSRSSAFGFQDEALDPQLRKRFCAAN